MHIPKTGGTSIEAWLEGYADLELKGHSPACRCNLQHLPARDILAMFGEGFFDYVFTVVRNPYDRIVSEYRMRSLAMSRGAFASPKPFSDWLEIQLDRFEADPWDSDNHIRPQYQFIEDQLRVKCFRFEMGHAQILRSLAADLGVPFSGEVPHLFKAPPETASLGVEWSNQTLVRFNAIFAADFRALGYELREPKII